MNDDNLVNRIAELEDRVSELEARKFCPKCQGLTATTKNWPPTDLQNGKWQRHIFCLTEGCSYNSFEDI